MLAFQRTGVGGIRERGGEGGRTRNCLVWASPRAREPYGRVVVGRIRWLDPEIGGGREVGKRVGTCLLIRSAGEELYKAMLQKKKP